MIQYYCKQLWYMYWDKKSQVDMIYCILHLQDSNHHANKYRVFLILEDRMILVDRLIELMCLDNMNQIDKVDFVLTLLGSNNLVDT